VSSRRRTAQALNEYWQAFHDLLRAQSVNPEMLAGSLFSELRGAHERFSHAYRGSAAEAVEALERLWSHVAARREVTADAPLTAREVAHARAQFDRIDEALQPGVHAGAA
jgi:hypothetical protein